MNQVTISNLMMQVVNQKDNEVQEDMVRHMVLNSLRSYRTKFYNDYGELVCPHTAVGLAVANNLREDYGDVPMVTLATAHPAKFPDSLKNCISQTPELPKQYQDLFSKNEVFIQVKNNFNDIKKIISERTTV